MKVFVCMPELSLKKAKVDRELYIVAFASDQRGASNHRPTADGAANATLADLTPEIEAAMKYFVIAASNIFHHVDKDQPPQLGGDGIVLYPPFDPQGMLALHVSVIESDAGARNQGRLLEGLFKDKTVSKELDAIAEVTSAAAAVPTGLVTAAMGAITSALPALLKANKDDVLLDIDFSGRALAKYHGSPDGRRHTFENKKVAASLMVFTEA